MRQPLGTINPYRIAKELVLDRMLWDINPKSWVSRARLRSWKDKFLGQKAVIICNGPSLLKTDFTLLNDTFTFGLNKINLLFDKSPFRPSCIVSVNRYVLEQNTAFFNATELPLFLDNSATDAGINFRSNVVLLHSIHGVRRIAQDCSISIHQGHTVTFVAMQLALHMGFQDVSLIGCDHSFASKGAPNQTIEAGEIDSDHFDPNYFAGGVRWQLPDLLGSEIAYSLARSTFEKSGRRLVNSTQGGNLEVFERVPLADFIGQR
jgi:6-hydroxymethylpterin diphosphokinase MptE-like